MNRIEQLSSRFEEHISLPWQQNLTSSERTIFVVYPKDDERRFRAKRDLFSQGAEKAGHSWNEVVLDEFFAEWMASQEYRDDYFTYPEDIRQKLESDFTSYVADRIAAAFAKADESSVLAILGVGSLFGLTKISAVLNKLDGTVVGRLVVFFPGSHELNTYRLLDAKDNWSYMAFPITLNESSYT